MNADAMKNLQELLENLSRDSEATGLKSEIASLEAKLANPDYYKTPNKADGTPAQTGDFGREYRNFSSHMNSVNESLNNLVNKKIEEIRNVQTGLDQTVEQLQLTGDEAAIAEASQAAEANRAILNNLEDLANKQVSLAEAAEQVQITNDEVAIADANAAIEENQRALDDTMMRFEDSADRDEYARLMADRAEEVREHQDFLARAEALQAKDANGNVYLDKNGNPVVNVNLYNMISDEKKLAKAKEAYANTNLGKLENVMAAFNVDTNDYTSTNDTPVDDVDTPINDTPAIDAETIAKYNEMILKGETFTDNENNVVLGTQLIKEGDTEILTWDEDNGLGKSKTSISDLKPQGKRANAFELEDMCSEDIDPEVKTSLQSIIYKEKHDYYFEHPEFGKVIPESEGVLEGGIVKVRNSKDQVVEVKLSDLISSDVLVDKAIDVDASTVDTTKASEDAKLAADRKANLAKALGDYTMSGSRLDEIEENGFYLPPKEDEAEEEKDDVIIKMPKKEEPETVVAAVAANAVDTKPADEMVEDAKANESEGEDMAKVQKEKNVQYSEATEDQKKQAKGKLTTLQKVLVGAGFVTTFAASLFGLNKLMDKLNEKPQDTTEIETEAPEEVVEEAEDKTISDMDHNKAGDEAEKETTTPSTTQPATPATPVEPIIGVPASTSPEEQNLINLYGFNATNPYTGESVAPAHVEEHQISQDASQQSINNAYNQINSGAVKPGDEIVLDNGEHIPVISQTVEYGGGGVQSVTETPVPGSEHEVLPSGVNPADVVSTNAVDTTASTQSTSSATTNGTETNTTVINVAPGDTQYSWEDSQGNEHVEEIPDGATQIQIEEEVHEEIPDGVFFDPTTGELTQAGYDTISVYSGDDNSMEGRSL